MVQITAVILTFNEERNIEPCIDSLGGLADEILVVDSFSNDRTAALAEARGARVLRRSFDGFLQQRRYGVEQAAHDRILLLDADERLSPRLRAAIAEVKAEWRKDVYYCRRLNFFAGKWIRHGAWYHNRKFRLFDRRRAQLVGSNPHDRVAPAAGAKVDRLKGDLLHFTGEDIDDRFDRINAYSATAAQDLRRRAVRGNVWRVLFKPVWRFIREYFLLGGFRDGLHGYIIASASAHYVFLREVKLIALWREYSQQKDEP
jgi:glycosyltransferase involved in cell wall biosynthesis